MSPQVKRPNKFGAHSDLTSWKRFLAARAASKRQGFFWGVLGEEHRALCARCSSPPNKIIALSFRWSAAACPDPSGTEKSILLFVISLLRKLVIGKELAIKTCLAFSLGHLQAARRGSCLQCVLQLPTNSCH